MINQKRIYRVNNGFLAYNLSNESILFADLRLIIFVNFNL